MQIPWNNIGLCLADILQTCKGSKPDENWTEEEKALLDMVAECNGRAAAACDPNRYYDAKTRMVKEIK